MRLILVTTKDVVTGEATTAPQMYRNVGEARRSWGQAINELAKNPNSTVPATDLQLYQLGEFDTETLEIVPNTQFIANGAEFIRGE